jgi:anti-sigma B factor antagonist
VIVIVSGEIDMMTSPFLVDSVLAELDPAPDVLTLDLRAVDFFGASGLTALLTILETVERGGGRMRVAQPSRFVRRTLDSMGLAERFGVYHPYSG